MSVRTTMLRRMGYCYLFGIERFAWDLSLEFKPADLWVGIFWKWSGTWRKPKDRLDLWICLVPCLPIHLRLGGSVTP